MASNDIIVRLRMLGAAVFTTTAEGAASAVRGIGTASESASKSGGKLSSALDKTSKALDPVWAMATRGGIALGAAGAAAVGMGVQFNSGMEQSTVAFTNLLGSADAAKSMLANLYSIAAHTPFEFPQLTQATQRLLGFGMAAKDVVPTMTAVGDAVAASGGGADQIDRVSTALGQMQAKGKVSSEELLQLAESGVPALKILQDQLGLTGQQLQKRLQGGAISADKGIAALVKGMEKRYGGMAAAQSKTFSGMLSTLKDNARQVLGTITMPLFTFLRDKVLPKVNEVTGAIGKWAKSGGLQTAMTALTQGFKGQDRGLLTGLPGIMAKIGTVAGKAFGIVKTYIQQFLAAAKPAIPFFRNVLLPLLIGVGKGVLGSVVAAFKVLIPIVRIVAQVLGWVGQKAAPLRGFFEKVGEVIGIVFGPAILKVIGSLGKLGGVFRIVGAAGKIAALPLRILGGLMRGLIGIVGKLFGVFGRIGPLAVKAVRALLKPFQGITKGFFNLGINIIKAIANGIINSPRIVLDAIKSLLPGGKIGRKLMSIVGLQEGGVLRAGSAFVGERGPELLQVSGGAARVYPLPSPSVSPIAAAGMAGGGHITVPVYLDGRVITQVVARRTADRKARR